MTTIAIQPAPLDIKTYAGDGVTVVFTFVEKATGEIWATGGSWVAQVRAPASSSVVVADFTVTVDEAAGKVTISLTGAQTRAISAHRDAHWDLQQIATGAEPRTWYAGRVTATGDVTRQP